MKGFYRDRFDPLSQREPQHGVEEGVHHDVHPAWRENGIKDAAKCWPETSQESHWEEDAKDPQNEPKTVTHGGILKKFGDDAGLSSPKLVDLRLDFAACNFLWRAFHHEQDKFPEFCECSSQKSVLFVYSCSKRYSRREWIIVFHRPCRLPQVGGHARRHRPGRLWSRYTGPSAEIQWERGCSGSAS